MLSEIWRVTDENGDGSIQKDEYLEMSRKLYRVVVGQEAGDEAEVLRVAEAEWEHDRFGAAELDRQRFVQSWFQLADLWTTSISAVECVRPPRYFLVRAFSLSPTYSPLLLFSCPSHCSTRLSMR